MKLLTETYKTNVITNGGWQPTAPPVIASPPKAGAAISALIILLAAVLLTSSASAAIIYVDIDATGSGNGSSWQNAYTDLQTGLDNASGTDDILVAQGTYHPNDADPNQQSFDLVHNVDVYGGYAGYGEADPNQRDWVNNVTILSGENTSGHVVDTDDVTATVSGFTVTGGGNMGIHVWNDSSLTIKHCLITDCGTAIYFGDGCGVEVTHCDIYDNAFWGIHGAGNEKYLTVLNCEIRDNGAEAIEFGVDDHAVIKNNLIHHNDGYGIAFAGADSHVIRNNTIVDNQGYGVCNCGATGTFGLSNCIIWGNYEGAIYYFGHFDLTYSCIDDSNYVSGPNNTIGDAPRFRHRFYFSDETKSAAPGDPNTIYVADASRYDVNDVIEYDNDAVPRTVTAVDGVNDLVTFAPDLDDDVEQGILIHNWGPGVTDVNENYHLLCGSPCIDTGDPCGTYTGETDLDGEPRELDGDCDPNVIVDMGVDEVNKPDCCTCWDCNSQCYGDGDCDDDVDFGDLFILRTAFGIQAGKPGYDLCADFSRDGNVNFADLYILNANFGTDPNNDCGCNW